MARASRGHGQSYIVGVMARASRGHMARASRGHAWPELVGVMARASRGHGQS